MLLSADFDFGRVIRYPVCKWELERVSLRIQALAIVNQYSSGGPFLVVVDIDGYPRPRPRPRLVFTTRPDPNSGSGRSGSRVISGRFGHHGLYRESQFFTQFCVYQGVFVIKLIRENRWLLLLSLTHNDKGPLPIHTSVLSDCLFVGQC